jgi:hypothetical protein
MTEQTTHREPPSQVPATEQATTSESQQMSPGEPAEEMAVGPIDYLAVELPGSRMDGAGLAALLDLVERGLIQILDLRVAMVKENGEFAAVEITDLAGDGTLDLAVFTGATSGLLDDDDVAASARLVEPGNAVAVLLYENTWARPFVTAMRHVGAEVIASGRIPAPDVLAMLDQLEAEAPEQAKAPS